MKISRGVVALLAGIAFCAAASAETGILIVHIVDIHQQPVVGISVRAGAGSSTERVDSFGQARIRLASNTHPGDLVFLELVSSNRDLVFISPLSRTTAVPSFDDKPSNFVEVILVKRGDRAMLENGSAAKSMVSDIIQGQPSSLKPIGSAEALRVVATKYGRSAEEIDLAIRNWGRSRTDPFEKGLSELYAKKYPEAEQSLRDSLREQKKIELNEKIKVSERAALLGKVLRLEGKFTEALIAYKDAVEYSPESGTYLFSLAFTNLDLNNAGEAERLAEDAIALDKKRFEADDPELAHSYYSYGAIFVNQGKYALGEGPFRSALRVAEQSFGIDSPSLLPYIDNLAIVFSAQGRNGEAESLITRAQAIEKISLSPDDPENAQTSTKLASFYMTDGRYLDASPLLEVSMGILRKYFTANGGKALPPDFGIEAIETLETLAMNRKFRGFANKDDLSIAQELLMLQRALTGQNSVDAAQRQERVGDILWQQGRYPEAEIEYRQALNIRKEQILPAAINLRAKLSYDLAAQGKQVEAEETALANVESLRVAHAAVGLILSAYNYLAELYSFEKKPEKAKFSLDYALSTFPLAKGQIEPERIEAIYRLAMLKVDEGKVEEANNQLLALSGIMANDANFEHQVVLRENLAFVAVKLHQCADASALLEKAAADASMSGKRADTVEDDVREKMISTDSDCHDYAKGEREGAAFLKSIQIESEPSKRFRILMLGHLGDIYTMDGKYSDAEQRYDQALSLTSAAQSIKMGDIASLLARKSRLYIKWKRLPEARQSSVDALTILESALFPTDPSWKEFLELRSQTCDLNNEGKVCRDLETRLRDFTRAAAFH